jgi:nitrite reductase (NADH) small subunit
MRVVHLDGGENFIEIGEKRFLVLRAEGKGCHTISAMCPHRGGPLHLGEVEDGGHFLKCPWHKTRVSIPHLLRSGMPTISTRGRVSIVISGAEADETPHACRRKTLLNAEAALAGIEGTR